MTDKLDKVLEDLLDKAGVSDTTAYARYLTALKNVDVTQGGLVLNANEQDSLQEFYNTLRNDAQLVAQAAAASGAAKANYDSLEKIFGEGFLRAGATVSLDSAFSMTKNYAEGVYASSSTPTDKVVLKETQSVDSKVSGGELIVLSENGLIPDIGSGSYGFGEDFYSKHLLAKGKLNEPDNSQKDIYSLIEAAFKVPKGSERRYEVNGEDITGLTRDKFHLLDLDARYKVVQTVYNTINNESSDLFKGIAEDEGRGGADDENVARDYRGKFRVEVYNKIVEQVDAKSDVEKTSSKAKEDIFYYKSKFQEERLVVGEGNVLSSKIEGEDANFTGLFPREGSSREAVVSQENYNVTLFSVFEKVMGKKLIQTTDINDSSVRVTESKELPDFIVEWGANKARQTAFDELVGTHSGNAKQWMETHKEQLLARSISLETRTYSDESSWISTRIKAIEISDNDTPSSYILKLAKVYESIGGEDQDNEAKLIWSGVQEKAALDILEARSVSYVFQQDNATDIGSTVAEFGFEVNKKVDDWLISLGSIIGSDVVQVDVNLFEKQRAYVGRAGMGFKAHNLETTEGNVAGGSHVESGGVGSDVTGATEIVWKRYPVKTGKDNDERPENGEQAAEFRATAIAYYARIEKGVVTGQHAQDVADVAAKYWARGMSETAKGVELTNVKYLQRAIKDSGSPDVGAQLKWAFGASVEADGNQLSVNKGNAMTVYYGGADGVDPDYIAGENKLKAELDRLVNRPLVARDGVLASGDKAGDKNSGKKVIVSAVTNVVEEKPLLTVKEMEAMQRAMELGGREVGGDVDMDLVARHAGKSSGFGRNE